MIRKTLFKGVASIDHSASWHLYAETVSTTMTGTVITTMHLLSRITVATGMINF